MRPRFSRLIVLTVPVILAACMSVPVTSLPRLASLNPETVDLAKTEVAVRVPEDFDIDTGGVRLIFAVTRENSPEKLEETFELEEIDGALEAGLQGHAKKGFAISRYRIAPADAPRLAAFRERTLALKSEPGKKAFSLSANAKPCLKPGANPFQDIKLTLFLRPAPDEDYFMLVKPTKLPMPTEKGKPHLCG